MECRHTYMHERKERSWPHKHVVCMCWKERTTLNKPKPWKHITTRSLCETSSKLFNWIHRLFRCLMLSTRPLTIHYYCVSFIWFSFIPFRFIFCLCCCCCVVAINSFICVHIWLLRDYECFGECFRARTIFSFASTLFCYHSHFRCLFSDQHQVP